MSIKLNGDKTFSAKDHIWMTRNAITNDMNDEVFSVFLKFIKTLGGRQCKRLMDGCKKSVDSTNQAITISQKICEGKLEAKAKMQPPQVVQVDTEKTDGEKITKLANGEGGEKEKKKEKKRKRKKRKKKGDMAAQTEKD